MQRSLATPSAQQMMQQLFPLMHELTWLVLGENPAARSRRVEQFTAPKPATHQEPPMESSTAEFLKREQACELLPTLELKMSGT